MTTVPLSMAMFCKGLLAEMAEDYEVVAVSSPGRELEETACREGVRTIAVPMERRISPLKDMRSLIRLAHLFIKERPDMVHSMTPKAGLLSMMAARMAGVPLRVHTFTGLLFPTSRGLMRRLLMLTDALTCAFSTHVMAEGEGVRNDLLCHHITRKDPRVLGFGNVRGVDLRYYRRTPEVKAAADDIRRPFGERAFVFLFVGRLVRDKGVEELVTAFCHLQASHPNTHLLLVGDEEDGHNPVSDATRRKISEVAHIHHVGWQTDVRPWYAAADALVLPSYREGFPNVVIEAGAMSLPAIVTDVNGSREIVCDKVTGLIVPPRNADKLYAAMRAFSGCVGSLHLMGENARSRVVARYEQRYVRGCLKEFYRELLG